MQQPVEERPFGVTLIAILLAINGVLAILAALGVFGPPVDGTLSVVLGLVFGLALLYLAYGMWTLQAWAWMATLILQGLNALFALLTLFMAPGVIGAWISLVIAAVIIFYLLQPSVREDFSRRRAGL